MKTPDRAIMEKMVGQRITKISYDEYFILEAIELENGIIIWPWSEDDDHRVRADVVENGNPIFKSGKGYGAYTIRRQRKGK